MSMATELHYQIFIKLPSCVSDVEFIKLVGRLMDDTKESKRHITAKINLLKYPIYW